MRVKSAKRVTLTRPDASNENSHWAPLIFSITQLLLSSSGCSRAHLSVTTSSGQTFNYPLVQPRGQIPLHQQQDAGHQVCRRRRRCRRWDNFFTPALFLRQRPQHSSENHRYFDIALFFSALHSLIEPIGNLKIIYDICRFSTSIMFQSLLQTFTN